MITYGIANGSYHKNFQEKRKGKVVQRLLSVREKMIKGDPDKAAKVDALENELDERGIEYPRREEILK